MKPKYEDWKAVIDKVNRDMKQREQLIVDMEVAAEIQETVLCYAKKKIKEFPEPKQKPLNKSISK